MERSLGEDLAEALEIPAAPTIPELNLEIRRAIPTFKEVQKPFEFFCVHCSKELPPGRNGRKCKECREERWRLSSVLRWRGDISAAERAPTGRLYDVNGAEIDLPVVLANLETGEVEYLKKDDEGSFEMVFTDWHDSEGNDVLAKRVASGGVAERGDTVREEVITCKAIYPSPLTFLPSY